MRVYSSSSRPSWHPSQRQFSRPRRAGWHHNRRKVEDRVAKNRFGRFNLFTYLHRLSGHH